MEEKRKIFRGCPYSATNIECKNCCNYGKCLEEKKKRQISWEIERIRKRKRRNLVIILVLALILSTKCCQSLIASEDTNFEATETTETTITTEATEPITTFEPTIETEIEIEETTELIQVLETKPITDVTVESTETGEAIIKISAEGPGEVYVYHVTEAEKILIAKVVYAEARGELLEGKVAVAAVILNRWVSDDPRFAGKSIEDIATAAYQFANTSWVTESHLVQVPECMEAVEMALKGWDPTRKADPKTGEVLFPDGAKFFYAPATISLEQMELRAGVPTLYIGNHAFHDTFNVVG